MITKDDPDEIADELRNYLSKNRSSMSAADVDLITETIELLLFLKKKTTASRSSEITETTLKIILNLLKIFSSTEWFQEILNKCS